MQCLKTDFDGVFLFEPKVFSDDRGYFCESFRQDIFNRDVGEINFIQENESESKRGVFRGLHFQLPPFAQSKLVRVVEGKVWDVIVDLRGDSPTFGKHLSFELSHENKRQLFIPKGFAHGFLTLSDRAVFQYKVDQFYSREADAGIRVSDPTLKIRLPVKEEVVLFSDKDKQLPLFEAKKFEKLNWDSNP